MVVMRPSLEVSIHASAREATRTSWILKGRMRCFDPRLREGGDSHSDVCRSRILVSIHASAREATARERIEEHLHFVSIHASAREATFGSCAAGSGSMFRSTPPRGRRR